MKKFVSMLAAAVLFTSNVLAAQVIVNDEYVDIPAVIEDERTFVPVRGVFEKLGFDVMWNGQTKTAYLTKSDMTIVIKSGWSNFTANGKTVTPDAPQRIIEDRFYIPLRAVVEVLPDCSIEWDQATKSVYIAQETNNMPVPIEVTETKPSTDIEKNSAGTSVSELEHQVLQLVNNERGARGIAPLEWSDDLADCARAHSKDMGENGYFSHEDLNGGHMADRIKDKKILGNAWAENIAAGNETAEDVVESWMESEGHRKNILNPNLKKLGVGLAIVDGSEYRCYWTQCFSG